MSGCGRPPGGAPVAKFIRYRFPVGGDQITPSPWYEFGDIEQLDDARAQRGGPTAILKEALVAVDGIVGLTITYDDGSRTEFEIVERDIANAD